MAAVKEHPPRLVYMPSGNGQVHTLKRLILSTNPGSLSAPTASVRATPPSRRYETRGTTIRPGHPSTSLSTTTDAKWGHFKRPRWGHCKRPLRQLDSEVG